MAHTENLMSACQSLGEPTLGHMNAIRRLIKSYGVEVVVVLGMNGQISVTAVRVCVDGRTSDITQSLIEWQENYYC